MRSLVRTRAAVIAAFAMSSLSLPASSQDAPDVQTLREQVRVLAGRLQEVERQLQLREANAAPPKPVAGERGLVVTAADGSLRLRGLTQLDYRDFMGGGDAADSAFVLRRARIIAEGKFDRDFSFQIVPEFGGSAVSVLDASFTARISDGLQFKFGKFKVPVGQELLQSDSWTFFSERAIVTNLVPNRGIGIQASGTVAGGRVRYAVGVFGDVGDGGSSANTDTDNGKNLVARVVASPFALSGLSLGIAGSVGRSTSAAGRTSGYRTDGQQTFFAFSNGVTAAGRSWRVAPQFDYRNGSFGAVGEFVTSGVTVRTPADGPTAELRNSGWQLAAAYVLTGEESSADGVVPRARFNAAAGTWGALELAGRVADIDIDDAAFPFFASPAGNADRANSAGLGLNWYLSRTVAFKFDLYRTRFGRPPATVPASPVPVRPDESVFISRFQVSF